MKRICEIYDISKDYEMPKGTVLIIVSDIEKDKIISMLLNTEMKEDMVFNNTEWQEYLEINNKYNRNEAKHQMREIRQSKRLESDVSHIYEIDIGESLENEEIEMYLYVYDKLFTEYNHIVGQLLITAPDIADGGSRKANFHNTMDRLLELGALPVINENDTISTEEIAVGDNDTLSAIVAATVSADLLVLLSDIDGLYDGDPRKNPDAKLIPTVETVDERIIALGGGSGSSLGTGGMATKLLAAQIAVGAGCEMVIANGEKPELLYDIVAGKPIGTRFLVKR